MTCRRIFAGPLFVVCLAQGALGGPVCSASSTPDASAEPRMYYVPAASLRHDRGFTVAGWVPQLRYAGVSDTALNDRLRSVVEQGINKAEVSVRPASGPFAGGGEFTVNPVHSFISATSVVFSALLPVTESRPHGTSSPYWLSVTLEVSNPRSSVTISDVVTASGLDRLAESVRSRLAHNKCVAQLGTGALSSATAPRATSFQQFALLPAGLAVGFPSSPGGPLYECGNFYVVVPYSDLVGAMSPAGKALAAGAAER